MTDLTGQTLGQYRIIGQLGRGGMAEVFKGYQPALDRYVAVKVLHPMVAADEQFLARFQREAKAVAALRHPHIVNIHDFGHEADRYYMVMEYIEGQTLKHRLDAQHQAGKRLALDEVRRIIDEVAGALDYAHGRGMIHRDVKPANVLLTAEGQAILSDFGIAHMVEGTRYTLTGVIGTPDYMSPEQGMGQPVDARSDIYSLGVVLYEMLTGRVPFSADTPMAVIFKHVQNPLPLPRSLNPSISEAVERVVLKAMAKSPEDRFSTAGQMAEALRVAIATGVASVPPPPEPEFTAVLGRDVTPTSPIQPPTAPEAGRPGVPRSLVAGGVLALVGLGVVALAVLGGVAWFLFGDRGTTPTPLADTPAGVPTATAQALVEEIPTETPAPMPTPTQIPTQPPAGIPAPTSTPIPTPTPAPSPTPTQTLAQREATLLAQVRYRSQNGPVVFAYQREAPPQIDGRLDDWPGYAFDIAHAVYQPENLSGPSDLSATSFAGWDNGFLYLGIRVIDDILVQTQSGEMIYRGDSIELQFDHDLAGDFDGNSLSDDDHQVGLSPGDFAGRPPEAYIWLPASQEQPGLMINLAARRTGDGYVLEAAIPWYVLGNRPALETPLGFCLNVNDNDTPATAEQRVMVSSCPNRLWGDPTTFGTLILVDWR